jgi:Mn-dependent DtxR family transcriptional regulator
VAVPVPWAFGLMQLDHFGPISAAALAKRIHEPLPSVQKYAAQLIDAGHVQTDAQGRLTLTASGSGIVDRLVAARRELLGDVIADPSPEQHAELSELLHKLARLTTDTSHDHLVGESIKRGA